MEDEKSNQVHISLRKDFDKSIREISGPEISPDDFSNANLKDITLYDMYEDDTIDAEGGLVDNSEYDDIHLMATGLYCQVPTPE